MSTRLAVAGIVLVLAATYSHASSVHSSIEQGYQQVPIDIRAADLPQAAAEFSEESIASLAKRTDTPAAPLTTPDMPSAGPAALVENLSINTAVLVPLGQQLAVRNGIATIPPGKRHLSVHIDSVEYVLHVVETVNDRAYPFRHVTALIVNQPGGGYVRFTVDDRADSTVATLKTRKITYRILPSATHPDRHHVFRLPAASGSGSGKQTAVSEAIATKPSIKKLEERHLLAEALAELQPAGYYVGPNFVTLFGKEGSESRLGAVDPALAENPEAIGKLISQLRALTKARGTEEYVIDSVARVPREISGAETIVVSFRQVLAGVPVQARQTLELAADTGHVRKLRVFLLDDSWLPDQTSMYTPYDASVIAERAVSEKLGAMPSAKAEKLDQHTSVVYEVGADLTLIPAWRTRYMINNGAMRDAFVVRVNLLTGEASVVSLTMYFSADIYKSVGNPPSPNRDSCLGRDSGRLRLQVIQRLRGTESHQPGILQAQGLLHRTARHIGRTSGRHLLHVHA